MLEEIAIGTIAGAGAATAEKIINPEKTLEDYLEDLCELLRDGLVFLKDTPQNKLEEHITKYIRQDKPEIVRYKGYLAVYFLTSVASTFTVTVSGLSSFVWTPTVGSYNRWRFPEGTTIQLLTPSQASLPCEWLYTDDISN